VTVSVLKATVENKTTSDEVKVYKKVCQYFWATLYMGCTA